MKKFAILAGLALASTATLSHASDQDLKWNGYMNLVGGMLKDEPVNEPFSTKKQIPGVDGYENRFTGMKDSLFALQASKSLAPNLSITGQLLAQGGVDSFKTGLAWAYANFTVDEHSSVRVGRMGLPTFYFSDFQYVGTAYDWVTPPREVYLFLVYYQGVSYLRHDTLWNSDFTTEFFAGSNDQDVKQADGSIWTSKLRDVFGASVTVNSFDFLTFRMMGLQALTNITTDFDVGATLEKNGITADSPLYAPLVADVNTALAIENDKYEYYDASLRADFARWYIMAEGMDIHSQTFMKADNRHWYVTAGVRFGRVTYLATYTKSDDVYSGADAKFSGLSKVFVRTIAQGAAADAKSIRLGARIDTTRTTALKFELEQLETLPSTADETAGIGKNMMARVAFTASF